MTFLLKSELMGGFPACLCARRTKKDKQRGGKLCRPAALFLKDGARKRRRREYPTFLILLKRRVVV